MSEPSTSYDWEEIERDYRANMLSLRAIGEKHGISVTYLRKRAKGFGWERNLSDRVRERIDEELLRTAGASSATEGTPGAHPHRAAAREESIIASAAALGVSILQRQRGALAELNTLREDASARLVKRLQRDKDVADRIMAAIKAGEKPNFFDLKYVPMSEAEYLLNVEIIAKIQYRIQPLERQAYNLDGKTPLPDEGAKGGAKRNVFLVPSKEVVTPEVRPMREDDDPELDP